MRDIRLNRIKKAKFLDLRIGDWFVSNGVIYVKTGFTQNNSKQLSTDSINAVAILTGRLTKFYDNEEVSLLLVMDDNGVL